MKVEVSTKHAAIVPTLGDAWTFIMDRLDSFGENPSIYIVPMWINNDFPDMGKHREFEVTVKTTKEEEV